MASGQRVQCNIIEERDKAIEVTYKLTNGVKTSAWIPLSQVAEIHRSKDNTDYSTWLMISSWWATSKLGFE